MLSKSAKIIENRLTFDQVTESLKVGTFLRHSIVILTYILTKPVLTDWL